MVIADLRYEMLKSKCGGPGQSLDSKKNIDLSALPPPRVSLQEHIRRVNYQIAIWKRAHIPKPEIPHPAEDQGWIIRNGRLEPCWFKGTALTASLADIAYLRKQKRMRCQKIATTVMMTVRATVRTVTATTATLTENFVPEILAIFELHFKYRVDIGISPSLSI